MIVLLADALTAVTALTESTAPLDDQHSHADMLGSLLRALTAVRKAAETCLSGKSAIYIASSSPDTCSSSPPGTQQGFSSSDIMLAVSKLLYAASPILQKLSDQDGIAVPTQAEDESGIVSPALKRNAYAAAIAMVTAAQLRAKAILAQPLRLSAEASAAAAPGAKGPEHAHFALSSSPSARGNFQDAEVCSLAQFQPFWPGHLSGTCLSVGHESLGIKHQQQVKQQRQQVAGPQQSQRSPCLLSAAELEWMGAAMSKSGEDLTEAGHGSVAASPRVVAATAQIVAAANAEHGLVRFSIPNGLVCSFLYAVHGHNMGP